MTTSQESAIRLSVDEASGKDARIIIGVDGSPASEAALRWAVAHASAHGQPPIAVYVWRFPPRFGVGEAAAPMSPIGQHEKAAEQARETLQEFVRKAFTGDQPTVEMLTIDNPQPGAALSALAHEASMLVLGSHRHHAIGPVVGSTIRGCLDHATCPVVVVPPSDA